MKPTNSKESEQGGGLVPPHLAVKILPDKARELEAKKSSRPLEGTQRVNER